MDKNHSCPVQFVTVAPLKTTRVFIPTYHKGKSPRSGEILFVSEEKGYEQSFKIKKHGSGCGREMNGFEMVSERTSNPLSIFFLGLFAETFIPCELPRKICDENSPPAFQSFTKPPMKTDRQYFSLEEGK